MNSSSQSQKPSSAIQGCIEECTVHELSGWISVPNRENAFTEVDVFLDDEFYLQISADLESRGLVMIDQSYPQPDKTGFRLRWELPRYNRTLKVSAKFAVTGQNLEGSPTYIEPAAEAKAASAIEDVEVYTRTTKDWLENRYKFCYQDTGIYLAHQPVYGFNSPYSEPGLIDKYLITYQIMQTLNMLDFTSILDVGGSEGYKAAMARDFFAIEAFSSDISQEACDRARDLYNISTKPSDMRKLDFDSESFDIVLCSESVEHVVNPKLCIEEMLRVAKKAVLITVPHESHEIVSQNISEGEMHGHVNYFDILSFEYLRAQGYEVKVRKILSRADIIYVPGVLMECAEHILPSIRFARLRRFAERFPKLTKMIFNKYVAASLLSKDSWAIEKYPDAWYHGVEALILKDPSILRERGRRKVSMLDVFNYKVPPLYLDKEVIQPGT